MPPPDAPTARAPQSAEEHEAERAREEASRHFGSNGSHAAAIGRTLPHSPEAEEYLLSTILIDPVAILQQCEDARVIAGSFYEPRHVIVFETLVRMRYEKKPIDVSSLAEELKTRRLLEQVGGYSFLQQISQSLPTTAQAGYFIGKVKEQAALRDIIRTATGLVEDCYNFTGDIDGFLAQAQERVEPVLRPHVAKGATYTVWSPAQFRSWTPPMELNLLGAGYLRRRQITTLIGPPGVGKSRVSLWLAVCHIAGRSWCGLEPKGGALRWLMVGNENDPERQKNDLSWFYRNLLEGEQKKVDDQLFLHVLESHEDSHLTLADPSAYNRMVATLRTVKPDVLVCDPWGNMIESNENDNEEVRRTLKLLLRAVSEGSPDAAVLIIHHARTGKTNTIEAGNNYSGGSLGRGSKVLVSQARCELALWPGDSEDATKLVLTCEKVNNAPKFEPVGLVFDNGAYHVDSGFSVKGWRDDIEGKRSAKTFTVADIVESIKAGRTRAKDIVAYADTNHGVVRSTVYARIKEACAKGYIVAGESGVYVLPRDRLTPDRTQPKNADDGPPLINPHDPGDTL